MPFTGELNGRTRRPSVPGANTSILYNSSGIEGASPNLTFDFPNNAILLVANTLQPNMPNWTIAPGGNICWFTALSQFGNATGVLTFCPPNQNANTAQFYTSLNVAHVLAIEPNVSQAGIRISTPSALGGSGTGARGYIAFGTSYSVLSAGGLGVPAIVYDGDCFNFANTPVSTMTICIGQYKANNVPAGCPDPMLAIGNNQIQGVGNGVLVLGPQAGTGAWNIQAFGTAGHAVPNLVFSMNGQGNFAGTANLMFFDANGNIWCNVVTANNFQGGNVQGIAANLVVFNPTVYTLCGGVS